jgi:hypothetical protein
MLLLDIHKIVMINEKFPQIIMYSTKMNDKYDARYSSAWEITLIST